MTNAITATSLRKPLPLGYKRNAMKSEEWNVWAPWPA